MIYETDKRIIIKMIETINRNINLVNSYEQEIEKNYIYSDSLQYEFEKLYEDLKRLSVQILILHPEIPVDKMRGLRNRIAHDYESVIISKLIKTVKEDFPILLSILNNILNS